MRRVPFEIFELICFISSMPIKWAWLPKRFGPSALWARGALRAINGDWRGWRGEKRAELGVGNWIEFPSKGSHKAGAVNVTLKDGYQLLKRNVNYVERGPRSGHSGVKRWKMAPGTAGDCYQRLGIAFDQHFSVLISGSHLAYLRPFVQPSMTLNILSLRLHMHSNSTKSARE